MLAEDFKVVEGAVTVVMVLGGGGGGSENVPVPVPEAVGNGDDEIGLVGYGGTVMERGPVGALRGRCFGRRAAMAG